MFPVHKYVNMNTQVFQEAYQEDGDKKLWWLLTTESKIQVFKTYLVDKIMRK